MDRLKIKQDEQNSSKQQKKRPVLFRKFSNRPKVTGAQILLKKMNLLFYCYTITTILNIYITSLTIMFKTNNHTFN
jgi:hypothetical protein